MKNVVRQSKDARMICSSLSLALALLAIPMQAEAAGDFDRSPEGYNRRISEDPKSPKLFMARAYMYHHTGYKAGHLDLALADYTTAISLDPDLAGAYEGRGEIYEIKGDLDRAILEYDQAIRLDQVFAQALYRRGVVKHLKGDTAAGDADLAAARKLDRGIGPVINPVTQKPM